MILVTGATGHVGSELLRQLAADGVRVRAMTRRPERAAMPTGVEVVRGDFDDPSSLDAAFAGVDRFFLMSAESVGNAPAPTHEARAVAAALRAGTRQVVKLSVLGGGERGGGDVLAAWHAAAEGAVRESGLAWTLVRPGRFMSNALAWAPMLEKGDQVHVPFASRAAASIDPADVAAVARVALLEAGHEGRAYELSGPEVLTPAEELAELARVLKRPLELVAVSNEAARAGMIRSGIPAILVDAIVERIDMDGVGADVLGTVEEVTGRRARTFVEWAAAHADAFR